MSGGRRDDGTRTGPRMVRRRGLSLTVMPPMAHVAPGGRQVVTLSVQNRDEVGHDCRIAVAGLPRAWYDLEAAHVALAPAATARLGLTLHPPGAPAVQRGLYLAGVELTAEGEPPLRASDTLEVVVGDGSLLDLSLSPPRLQGRAAVFDVTVRNEMAWPAPVALDLSDTAEALVFDVTPSSLVLLQPGETITVRVRATLPARSRKDAAHGYDVAVGARLPEQSEGRALVERHLRLAYGPGLWAGRLRSRWALLAPSLLVLALLAGLAGRLLATGNGRPAARPALSAGAARPPRAGTPVAMPDLLVNPTWVDLGRPGNRHPYTALIHIVNLGVRPLRLDRVAVIGQGAHDFATQTTCTRAALGAEASCTIRVRFRPRAGRLSRAVLTVSVPRAGIVVRVPLAGQG